MRITESQLRRIIRQEVRALRESNLSTGPTHRYMHDFIHGAWMDLAGTYQREVPVEALASKVSETLRNAGIDIEVFPEDIRWDRTGLRLMGGLVTELL